MNERDMLHWKARSRFNQGVQNFKLARQFLHVFFTKYRIDFRLSNGSIPYRIKSEGINSSNFQLYCIDNIPIKGTLTIHNDNRMVWISLICEDSNKEKEIQETLNTLIRKEGLYGPNSIPLDRWIEKYENQ